MLTDGDSLRLKLGNTFGKTFSEKFVDRMAGPSGELKFILNDNMHKNQMKLDKRTMYSLREIVRAKI